ncbi:cobalamin biosynthesis protein [Streptomyces sp. NPDC102406]|uniref:cobalamin biosynthesis protein n=1 Tax=Streptomyces sp. NPDC102406 TaxID=3366171 RepID=UPI00380FA0A5
MLTHPAPTAHIRHRPGGVIVGVGARAGAAAGEVLALVRAVLAEAGSCPGDVVALATVDAKGREPGIVAAAGALGVPLVTYGAGLLATVPVPRPSERVRAAAGTPSVAEAAALAGGGELLVPKRVSVGAGGAPGRVTCAVARAG